MKIELNITKTNLFLTIFALVVVLGGIFAYAYTSSPGITPDPGHTLSSIQGYFSGDSNLQQSLDKLCQKDGTNCPSGLFGSAPGIVNFTSPGSYTWTIPSGVSMIRVEAWGGGGTGGVSTGSGCVKTSIGGDGAFVRSVVNVVAGETCSIVVGAASQNTSIICAGTEIAMAGGGENEPVRGCTTGAGTSAYLGTDGAGRGGFVLVGAGGVGYPFGIGSSNSNPKLGAVIISYS